MPLTWAGACSKALQTLSIAYCMLDDEVLVNELVRAIQQASTLRELCIRACLTAPMLPKTLPPLVDLAGSCASLRLLDLTGNCLHDAGVERLISNGLSKTQVSCFPDMC